MRLETAEHCAEHWRERHLSVVPAAWYWLAKKRHQRKGGDYSREANRWLADLAERMGGFRVPVGLTDDEICTLADSCAREAMNLAGGPRIYTVPEYRARLSTYVGGYGIEPPEPERVTRRGKVVGIADLPAIRRMTDAQWWRRALRRYQARALEREAIGLGIVHRPYWKDDKKVGEPYASDVTVERRAQQRRRNAATLEGTEAINLTTGESYTLADLAALAVSNPRIRRGELMVRIRGFEEVATGLDHAAEFVTLTTPSSYHAKKVGAGGTVRDNPKFAGATPREAQRYLSKVWANCRAALWRRGLRPYGFRIAEPHHDGTPHWHMLLFIGRWLSKGRAAVPRLRAIIRRYFLREDSGEAGARTNRVKFVAIDAGKGTAAGYVAKYVSKNIDGYQVQGDIEGGCDAVTGSQRVEAWASTWGIRQFQQVGGPPVGVWRELRRVREADESHGPIFEAARSAADAGNWRRYVEVQGGPQVSRGDTPLKVAYTRPGERVIAGEPEPAAPTRYGEVARPAVFGVEEVGRGVAHGTRFFRWEIRRAGNGRGRKAAGAVRLGFSGSAQPAPRSCVNNCSRPSVAGGESGREKLNREGAGAEIRGSGGAGSGAIHAEGHPRSDRRAGATMLRHGDGNRNHAEGI